MVRVLSLGLVLTLAGIGGASAAGDPVNGEKIFKRCQACHVINQEQNRVGPYLHGVIGRHAGMATGFNYSPAMKAHDVVWDDAELDKYLADPKGSVPGNKMAFPGLKKPEERADVIAYLKQASAQ